MDIKIAMPYLLWLLLGNFLFFIIPSILKKKKNYFYISLRVIVYSLIIIGLSGVTISSDAKETHTIILVDRSDSMIPRNEDVKAYISKQLENKPEAEYVEIIAFGEDVAIEHMMSQGNISYQEQVVINKRATNLDEAIAFSKNRFDHDKNKRLVVVSDFQETTGDLVETLINDGEMAIEYKHYVPELLQSRDSQIASVIIPKRVSLGEEFPVAVSIYSNEQMEAKLTIISDDEIVVQKDITLTNGMQRFLFEDTLKTTGTHQYIARITSDADTVEANNQWHNIVEVDGPPNLLIVDSKDEAGVFEQLLISQGILTKRFVHNWADFDLEDLSTYDGVVLVNASIETLSTKFLNALELYLKELGGGVLVIGGGESYAVGGYENTQLEKILPINMSLKSEGERYDLAMMTVIDKSGSMESDSNGPSRMKMAKEAVLRVAGTLSENDQLGLIAFDGMPHEVFPLMQVDDMDKIAKAVAGVKANGGTSILPALKSGLEALNDSKLKGKHLLLVSDGQGEQGGYEMLIEEFEGITISTIAIGEGADARTMEYIAELGNGRFYQVTDYRKIPEIFTKETRLAMDEFIKEGLFVPERNSRHQIVNGITQLPIVYGYVGTSIKAESELILSIEEEPLLALWQYGLGKSMAWTSDVSNWTRAFYEQEQGVQLLTDLPSAIFGTQEFNSVELDATVNNNTLSINGFQNEGRVLDIDMITKDGQTEAIEITQFNDGYFDGDIPTPDEGFVFIRVKDTVTNELLLQTPMPINYSKEYDQVNKKNIAGDYQRLNNSVLLTNEDNIFTIIEEQTLSEKMIGDLLLILALFIFIVDVASRKLRFDPIQRIIDKNKIVKQREIRNTEVNRATSAHKSNESTPPTTTEKVKSESVIDTGRLLSKKRK